METSKKLTWIFVCFYLLQITITGFIKIKFDKDLLVLLDYTTPLATIIFTSYFIKSGLENTLKIKQNQ